MGDRQPELTVNEISEHLYLSPVAARGCRERPDKAVLAILIGWQVVVEHCLAENERSKLTESPTEAIILSELRKIYTTNWPNMNICRVLRSSYDAEPQDWWEQRDVRGLLDIAVRSAVEAMFSCLNEATVKDRSGDSED